MASAKLKPEEKQEIVIEEEIGVFQHTIKQISPSTQEKRKQDEVGSLDSPSKYIHHADRNRFETRAGEENSLKVPFWKHLNQRQSSFQFRVDEIGCFSLEFSRILSMLEPR